MPPVKAPKETLIDRIACYIQGENKGVSLEDAKTIARQIYEESRSYGVDYRLVLAIVKKESNFNATIVSHRGARGLLQIRPVFAKHIANNAGVEWNGPKTLDDTGSNIRMGIHFFTELIQDFNRTDHALHAYNMGPVRLKGILAAKESPKGSFASQVLKEYEELKLILPASKKEFAKIGGRS